MIKHSELILNRDGSIFHLHLKPEDISDTIILVGDPGRVEMIGKLFEKTELTVRNREFATITGYYRKQRLTVLSTGIGTDNIDIVVNELDALANIDLATREPRPEHRTLRLVRIGTSGGMQADLPLNSLVVSAKSLGFDGMLNFYAGREAVCDLAFEDAFRRFMNWNSSLPTPYAVNASEQLLQLFSGVNFVQGVTISAPGFYGPQGRVIRLPLAVPDMNERLEEFSFNGQRIFNYEMESSAIYGLSRLLGHEALAVCLIIANRVTLEANENYYPKMEQLVKLVLDKLTN